MKTQIRGFLLIFGGILVVVALSSRSSWTASFKQLLVACGGAAVAYGIGMAIGWTNVFEQFSLERMNTRKGFAARVAFVFAGLFVATALLRFNPL